MAKFKVEVRGVASLRKVVTVFSDSLDGAKDAAEAFAETIDDFWNDARISEVSDVFVVNVDPL